jgi:hypothetical protein
LAARTDYIVQFLVGAKLLATFRSTLAAAQARLKGLEASAKTLGKTLKWLG